MRQRGRIRPAFIYSIHIFMRLCPRLYSSLIILLSCISRLALRSIAQLPVMTSDSSLSGREDTSAPVLTPAVTVRGRWFVTTSGCLNASLLQVQAVAVRLPSASPAPWAKDGVSNHAFSKRALLLNFLPELLELHHLKRTQLFDSTLHKCVAVYGNAVLYIGEPFGYRMKHLNS